MAEDALQSFQRLHCLRGEVGVANPIVFMGGKLVGRCRRIMSVAMQGNTLNDLGMIPHPLGNYTNISSYLPAGSVESMSFPAETRLVGIWTRSMEGS